VAIYRLQNEQRSMQGGSYAAIHAGACAAAISVESANSFSAPAFTAACPARLHRPAGRVQQGLRLLAHHWIWLGPLMIVAVGLFDLICTISAFERGWLVEMNPLANAALNYAGAAGLTVYRFVMTSAGCILLTWGMRTYRLRRFVGSVRRVRAVVWTGQAVLVATHAALVCWWIAWLSV